MLRIIKGSEYIIFGLFQFFIIVHYNTFYIWEKFIEAIKKYRMVMGLNLKECKKHVDNLSKDYNNYN